MLMPMLHYITDKYMTAMSMDGLRPALTPLLARGRKHDAGQSKAICCQSVRHRARDSKS